jgi:hypothetical protein
VTVRKRILGIGLAVAEQAAKQTYRRSQRYVPVDTGALKQSGKFHKRGAVGWEVTYGAKRVLNPRTKQPTSDYAGPVHWGHPNQAQNVKRHAVKAHHRTIGGRGQSVKRYWVKRYTRQVKAVQGRLYLQRAYEETINDMARFTRDAAGRFSRRS